MMRITSPSPLQLDGVDVLKLVMERNEEAASGGSSCPPDSADQYRINADFEVYHIEGEPRRHLVTLQLVLKNRKEAPRARFSRLEVKIEGVFSPDPAFDDEVIRRLIPGNCLAMLHGAARGIVMATTGSCRLGCFLLPAVNYQELMRKKLRAVRRKAGRDAGGAPE